VHVRQSIVATGVVESQAFVVEAERVQDRRLEVVDVDRVLDDVEAGYVSRTQAKSAYGVVIERGSIDQAATTALRAALRNSRETISVLGVPNDEYDDVGRRICRVPQKLASSLGVKNGDLVEYVPRRLGPHMKAWVVVDRSLSGSQSPLGPKARSVMRARGGSKIVLRPLEPPI